MIKIFLNICRAQKNNDKQIRITKLFRKLKTNDGVRVQ